jgi:hypothetical protein
MKKSFIILSAIILSTAIVETVLREYYSVQLTFPDRPMIYRADSMINYSYIPDTFFIANGEKKYINKQGFIDGDFGKKTSDSYRIAFTGVCGVAGPLGASEYNNFCAPLQRIFRENGEPVRTLNCGIDGGMISLEIFNLIKYRIIDFDPDMILWEYRLPFFTYGLIRTCYRGRLIEYPRQDPQTLETGKRMVDRLLKYKKWIDFAYSSYIFRATVRLYKNLFDGCMVDCQLQGFAKKTFHQKLRRYIELYEFKKVELVYMFDSHWTEYTMEESILMLQELNRTLQKKGIRFFMYQYGKDSDIINLAKENELPLISLNIAFTDDDFLPEKGHWNRSGYQKVAEQFYKLIMKYELIPDSYTRDTNIKHTCDKLSCDRYSNNIFEKYCMSNKYQ